MLGAKGFTLDKNLYRQREIMFNTFIMLLEIWILEDEIFCKNLISCRVENFF